MICGVESIFGLYYDYNTKFIIFLQVCMSEQNKKECVESMEDELIVKSVQNGELKCFDIIINKYNQQLFCYVMRFVKNPDEAKDIVQNVFIKALNHIDSFDIKKKFSSWIYRIAHNESINYLTRKKPKNIVSIDDDSEQREFVDLSDTTTTALDEWFQIELRDELHDAVAQLPDNYAEVIKLHYFEDKSYKEISESLSKPTSSVGTLLRRAKKRLLKIVLESDKF